MAYGIRPGKALTEMAFTNQTFLLVQGLGPGATVQARAGSLGWPGRAPLKVNPVAILVKSQRLPRLGLDRADLRCNFEAKSPCLPRAYLSDQAVSPK